MSSMTDLTERLRWLLADATPGPWKRKGNDVLDAEGGLVVSFTTAFRADATQKKRDKADPNLVAEAITALPDLLTTLETLTQEVERLREAGWRDIESAPTDPEDPILLLLYEWHDMGGFMFVGTFDHAKSQWFNNLDHQTQHPTHWMPLPPAPARKALGGGDE